MVVRSEILIRQPRKAKPITNKETKLKQIKRALDIMQKEIGSVNIRCREINGWKAIAVCGLACDVQCTEFLSRRWLCKYGGECSRLVKCEEIDFWCKEFAPKLKLIEDYLKLYAQWRAIRKSP